MIIDIEPGGRAEVPTDADFLIRTATSFSAGELIGVMPVMQFRRYDGAPQDITGVVSNTDFLFAVTPAIFTEGEWTANPRAVVDGKVRRWPESTTLIFKDPLSGVPACAC